MTPRRAKNSIASHTGRFFAAAAAPVVSDPIGLKTKIAGVELQWLFAIAILWVAVALIDYFARRYEKLKTKTIIDSAKLVDPAWEEDKLLRRIAEVFFKFEEAWCHFDIYAIKQYATERYYRLLVMELGVLKRQQRQNFILIPQIRSLNILQARDEADNERDVVVAEFETRMDNILMDTESGDLLHTDYGYKRYFWVFRRENDIWKVDAVRANVERSELIEAAAIGFAQRHGFFYDPDFAGTAMPNKGSFFRHARFGRSVLNYHVIGTHRGRIVQFYTYRPGEVKRRGYASGTDEKKMMLGRLENPYGTTGCASFSPNVVYASGYVVAQAIVPFGVTDVLVRKRRRPIDITPWGLRKFKISGSDARVSVYADRNDHVQDCPLLTPAFLECVASLPFDLRVEIIGSFLYLYAKSRAGVTYEKMLEILDFAMTEMKL